MDASDEPELALQRVSSELLFELRASVPRFLSKSANNHARAQPRNNVSYAALGHLIKLLEPFQEWPQLLDAHLEELVVPIGETFLEILLRSIKDPRKARIRQGHKLPMVSATCKILYAFCKIRGPKIICRFLSNEPRYLSILIRIFENWQDLPSQVEHGAYQEIFPLGWEEKYIVLLWTSHLLLTPFDLHSLASDSLFEDSEAFTSHVQRLQLPPGVPGIAVVLMRIAISQISAASKERDAAVAILVRICTRPDMQRLGIDNALVRWAGESLEHKDSPQNSPSEYRIIGLLSFLGHVTKAADVLSLEPLLLFVFNKIKTLDLIHSERSSAIARIRTIKLLSAIARASLLLDRRDGPHSLSITDYVLEDIVNDLLAALADSDTPVRQAASKALSIVTLNLNRSMAAQIWEAVIAGLEEDVLWDDVPEMAADGSHVATGQTIKQRNLAAVSPSRWQGLVLTLAHLLFRKAPPISQLPAIVKCLILALGFEQRSPSGATLGSNVRDAACFGIWSLVRKYATKELLAIDARLIPVVETIQPESSVLQMLAIELLTTAILDPSGNIRRGASAALQELIGRHPDAIDAGIQIVQAVDYHAVGLRSRALTEVSVKAASLGRRYWMAIITGLLTWRGIGATDVESRRLAAEALGLLTVSDGRLASLEVLSRLWQSLNISSGTSVPNRQGFLLSVAEVIKVSYPHLSSEPLLRKTIQKLWDIFSDGLLLVEDDFESSTLRPELTAEGACSLMTELAKACTKDETDLQIPDRSHLDQCLRYTNLALGRNQATAIHSASKSARSLLNISPAGVRMSWLQDCVQRCRESQRANTSGSFGHITALGYLWSGVKMGDDHKHMILEALISTCQVAVEIDARIAAVRSLKYVMEDQNAMDKVFTALETALQDYTMDQRGDIGSVLRLEAISVLQDVAKQRDRPAQKVLTPSLQILSTLAGEKLDRVRLAAWRCFACLWKPPSTEDEGDWSVAAGRANKKSVDIEELTYENCSIDRVTSRGYFVNLMSYFQFEELRHSLLKGLVTSFGGGSESLLFASRHAFSAFVETLQPHQLVIFCRSFESLLRDSLYDERLIVPILESLRFLLDINVIGGSQGSFFRWRSVLVLVQKAHYKSTSGQKVQAALEVYLALGRVKEVRREVLKKISSLLSHPVAKVRSVAADNLFILTQDHKLVTIDWMTLSKAAKGIVREIQESHAHVHNAV